MAIIFPEDEKKVTMLEVPAVWQLDLGMIQSLEDDKKSMMDFVSKLKKL